MNIILLSQGSALTIFHRLLPHLKEQLPLKTIGFFVADQHYFETYTRQHPDLLENEIQLLKEWELLRTAKTIQPNPALLEQLDHAYGNPHLWSALIADRRIWNGPNTKYTQDYAPRLSRRQMLQFIQRAVQEINHFIDKVQPDYVLGFNMVTAAEYLFYLITKARGIPYGQLKNAKIENYITLMPDPLTLSAWLKQEEAVSPPAAVVEKAHAYLAGAQQKQSTYEGHVLLKPPGLSAIFNTVTARKLTRAAAFELLRRRRYPHDTQSGGLAPFWHFNIKKPLRTLQQQRFLADKYIKPAELPRTPYIFFPLHTEPEVATSVYAPHHLNQIEVVRNIAQSIPITWQVIVKDHPRSLGLRTTGYYQKLLQIPNLRLIDPYVPSYDVIEHCRAVATITGWVGFEAAMSKKPIVTFGECSFNALPDSMVVKNRSYTELPADISRAIENYTYDEAALLHHIAAVIYASYPINLYSEILKKPGRHKTATEDTTTAIAGFASYIVQRMSAAANQIAAKQASPAPPAESPR